MFFNSVSSLQHTAIVGVLGYVGIIILLRISGKRTLSKWNSFDFIVTIALGSILASLLLSESTSLSQGILAFALLIFAQFVLSWLAVRSPWIQRFVKSEPSLLFYQGEFRAAALRDERVSKGEILAAIRVSGCGDLHAIKAVVLETDGSFSVIQQLGDHSALQDVRGI